MKIAFSLRSESLHYTEKMRSLAWLMVERNLLPIVAFFYWFIIVLFDYSFSSAYILKALHNPNFHHEGGAYRQFQGSRACLFSDLSAGDSCPLRIAPRSFGPGDLRFPPLIPHEKTAPSRQSLPKSPALFRVRMSKKELRL